MVERLSIIIAMMQHIQDMHRLLKPRPFAFYIDGTDATRSNPDLFRALGLPLLSFSPSRRDRHVLAIPHPHYAAGFARQGGWVGQLPNGVLGFSNDLGMVFENVMPPQQWSTKLPKAVYRGLCNPTFSDMPNSGVLTPRAHLCRQVHNRSDIIDIGIVTDLTESPPAAAMCSLCANASKLTFSDMRRYQVQVAVEGYGTSEEATFWKLASTSVVLWVVSDASDEPGATDTLDVDPYADRHRRLHGAHGGDGGEGWAGVQGGGDSDGDGWWDAGSTGSRPGRSGGGSDGHASAEASGRLADGAPRQLRQWQTAEQALAQQLVMQQQWRAQRTQAMRGRAQRHGLPPLWQMWYLPLLRPGTAGHYLPVRISQVERWTQWCLDRPGRCRRVALNAYCMMAYSLRVEALVEYMSLVMGYVQELAAPREEQLGGGGGGGLPAAAAGDGGRPPEHGSGWFV